MGIVPDVRISDFCLCVGSVKIQVLLNILLLSGEVQSHRVRFCVR